MNLLSTYVGAWQQTASALLEVCRPLTDDQWALATDCPGWTVKDVVAHCAHLEYVLATGDDGDYTHTDGAIMSSYTQIGVDTRRDRTPAALLDEFETGVQQRSKTLEPLPTDPHETASVAPGGTGWSWDTLLRNRALDLWVHEQDIRRAIGQPGGMNTTGAQVTTMTLGHGMPFVLGKKAQAPAGTSCVWDVHGEVPFHLVAVVDENGRAHQKDDFAGEPTVTLSFDTEAFTILAAGRRGPQGLDVRVDGDEALGAAIVSVMAVTP